MSRRIPAVSPPAEPGLLLYARRQGICHMLPRRRLTTLLALTSDAAAATAATGRSADAHTTRGQISLELFALGGEQPLGNCVHSRTQTAGCGRSPRLIPRDRSKRHGAGPVALRPTGCAPVEKVRLETDCDSRAPGRVSTSRAMTLISAQRTWSRSEATRTACRVDTVVFVTGSCEQ